MIPDFFLDSDDGRDYKQIIKEQKFEEAMEQQKPSGGHTADVGALFDTIQTLCSEELVKSTGGVFEFHLNDGSVWHLDLKNGAG